MAGLEKIIGQILKEAEENAAAVRKEAEEKAQEVIGKAETEAEAIGAEAQAEADAEAEKTRARFESLADTRKKQAFLTAKQGMIADAIAKAKSEILAKDDTSYFAMISKKLADVLQAKDGILSFNQKDLARLPKDFTEKAKAAAQSAGGTLTVSDKPADIDGGFILSYGGIDENCSVSAIFEEKADELSDTVQKLLFS